MIFLLLLFNRQNKLLQLFQTDSFSIMLCVESIASARSIDQDQPAQVQADLSRYFLLLVNFLNVQGPFYLRIQPAVRPIELMDQDLQSNLVNVKCKGPGFFVELNVV